MSAAPLRRRAPVRPARPATAPRRRTAPARAPAVARPRGAILLDRLLSGQLWIGLVFLLLVGIVFFNVDLLRMNRDIAVTAEKAETVKRQNARLRGDLARLGSSERIQKVAAQSGLVLPAPGEVRYLKTHGRADAATALKQLQAGDSEATTPTAGVPAPGQEASPQVSTPSTTPQAAPVAAQPTSQTTTTTPQVPTATPVAAPPAATTPPAGQ
jgi:cell division protein FtsL